MHLVTLWGLPGVGKLSVARVLAERTGYRLFHNHLTVDLLLSLFEFGSPPFVELRERIWLDALTRAADEGAQGVIFTVAFDRTLTPAFPAELVRAMQAHGARVSSVELRCDTADLENRVSSTERARYGKLNAVPRWRELAAQGSFARPALPDDTAMVDTTGLPVDESASRVLRALGR